MPLGGVDRLTPGLLLVSLAVQVAVELSDAAHGATTGRPLLTNLLRLACIAQSMFVIGMVLATLPVYLRDRRMLHIVLLAVSYLCLTLFTAYGIFTGQMEEWWRIAGANIAYALGDVGLLRILPTVRERLHLQRLTLSRDRP